MSPEDIAKDALGRLLHRYAQVSDNKTLVDNLRKLLPRRNWCAHQGLLLTTEQQKDVAWLDLERTKLEKLHADAKEYVVELMHEWDSLQKKVGMSSNNPVDRSRAR